MAEQKTKPTVVSVDDFIAKVESETVRDDCRTIVKIMKRVTGEKPKMWGPSIIGFGQYQYKYESGHEGFACLAGFSPRKANITLYVMNFTGRDKLLEKFGKFKTSGGCLYFKKLEDVDTGILEKLVERSVDYLKKKFPEKNK